LVAPRDDESTVDEVVRCREHGDRCVVESKSGFRASWRLVVARAKLSNIRFHDLRRKAGSDADDLDHAQELLGHADAKVTRKHYRAKPVAVQPIGIKPASTNGGKKA